MLVKSYYCNGRLLCAGAGVFDNLLTHVNFAVKRRLYEVISVDVALVIELYLYVVKYHQFSGKQATTPFYDLLYHY